MADWSGIYNFDSADDLSIRVRRLERGNQYLRAGKRVSPSGKYGGIPNTLLDTHNRISLASGVSTQGSIPPSGVVGNFGFTATTTSITIYWDGTNGSTKLKLIRADKTAVQIPTGSMTVNGLTANTNAYGFLPFWSPFNNCGIGFVKGDSGNDPAKFAFSPSAQTIPNSVQQSQQGREPLTSGFITYPTPAAGSSSGGGTRGGYGGGCVILGTDILPLGESGHVEELLPQTDWIHIQADGFDHSLNCTPDHPLYGPDRGKTRAQEFNTGDWIITDHGLRKIIEVRPFLRVCTKVKVKMPHGHLYWANGYLSNNVKLY